jgi:hypothetical protein
MTIQNSTAMKAFIIPLFIALTASFFSCKPVEIAVDPSLNAQPMPVKGRQGLQIGQVIRYGDFKTDKVHRGWTRSYDVPFVVRFRGAKEKLSFTQFGPESQAAEVSCISKFKSTEIMTVREYFSVPVKIENFFAGNISFGKDKPNWDFILYNPNGDFLREDASAGYIQNGSKRIELQAIRGLKGQADWMKQLTVYGHEFRYEGKVVAAVSTINNGKVWIDDSLDAETKTVIAAVATGILLRNDVEDTAVDTVK